RVQGNNMGMQQTRETEVLAALLRSHFQDDGPVRQTRLDGQKHAPVSPAPQLGKQLVVRPQLSGGREPWTAAVLTRAAVTVELCLDLGSPLRIAVKEDFGLLVLTVIS